MNTSKDFSHLDDPSFQKLYADKDSKKMNFFVEGLRCSRCIWKIEDGLMSTGLAQEARVNMSDNLLEVSLPENGSFAAVASKVENLGFTPHPIQTPKALLDKNRELTRSLLIRLGVAAAASGNIMILAIAVYAGAEAFWAKIFDWISFFLFLPVIFYSAQGFFVNSYRALINRRASIDMPIAMALGVGGSLSTYHLFTGSGVVYFDSMSLLVFLLLCSRLFLHRIQQKYLSPGYLEPFLNVQEVEVWDETKKSFIKTPLQNLKVDDIILVRSGQKIPADGELLSEETYINTSLLTGESLPQKIKNKSLCYAGTEVFSIDARIRVTHIGSESRMGKILHQLQTRALSKTPLISFTDRFAQNFTFLVIGVGVVFFTFYSFIDLNEAIKRVLALSLVACPCALVFATPLSQSFSLMKAARKGFFIKKAEALERLTQIKNIFFDKTGTLTEGQVKVQHWFPEKPDETLSSILLGLEKNSNHPISYALRRELEGQYKPLILESWKETPGKGVQGIYNKDFYELKSHTESPPISTTKALTWVSLFKNNKPLLQIGFGDPIRSEASTLINDLQLRGINTYLLSGDHSSVVSEVAKALKIAEAHALYEKSPEEKQKIIAEHPFSLMVGDGHNDSIALAQAHVSLAVHGSMESCLKTSDIYLSQPGVKAVTDLLRLSRETMKVIKRNLGFSLIYNLIAGTAALSGLINPLVAAILMPIASFIVLSSSVIGTRWLRDFNKATKHNPGKASASPHLWPVAQENI